ncbi:MAG TPA: hypothetical protein DC017_11115 [Candidatus Wallbacteria bacterium]|nr:hypothetical protein [Candidatus Wallbacteria bacterium]
MAIIRKSNDEISRKPVVCVDMQAGDKPVFPPVCPCCMSSADEGAFINAAVINGNAGPVRVPACAACAKHSVIIGKIAGLAGTAILILAMLTIFAGLFIAGSRFITASGDKLYEWAGIYRIISWPFRDLMHAFVTLISFVSAAVIYFLLFRVLMIPIERHYCKRSCKWFNCHVSVSERREHLQKYVRYTFENPEYGSLFAASNGYGDEKEVS